jgi:hypothetical protein
LAAKRPRNKAWGLDPRTPRRIHQWRLSREAAQDVGGEHALDDDIPAICAPAGLRKKWMALLLDPLGSRPQAGFPCRFAAINAMSEARLNG